MKLIKRLTFLGLLAGFFFIIPCQLWAQPIDPCTDPAAPCPIDNNIIILIIAALALAAKKTYDYKKTAQNV